MILDSLYVYSYKNQESRWLGGQKFKTTAAQVDGASVTACTHKL